MQNILSILYVITTLMVSSVSLAQADEWDIYGAALTTLGDDNQQKVKISATLSTVGDQVDYEPNLPDGSYASPKKTERYISAELGLEWRLSDRWHIEAGGGYRELTSKRDQFELLNYRLGLYYKLPTDISRLRYLVSLKVQSNQASVFDKNSYSRYGDRLLTSVQVHDPHDTQVQATLAAGYTFNRSLGLVLFSGFGHVRTRHDRIGGTGTGSDGCNYKFDVTEGGGSLQQVGVCGTVLEFSQHYPDYQAVEAKLGFNPNKDVQFDAGFWRAGAALYWSRNNWSGSLGYSIQQFDRGAFDSRIRGRGYAAVTTNQSLTARLTYQFKKGVSLSATSEYQQHQMLTELPVLYTGLTSERFEGDALFLAVSLNYRFRSG